MTLRVSVTGASGFLGAYLLRELRAAWPDARIFAVVRVPPAESIPGLDYVADVPGSDVVFHLAGAAGIDRALVHTSTSEVYGTARRIPIDEEHPLTAQSPYAASKIAADALVTSFNRSFLLPTVTVRPFNTFGPRQSGRAVIPTIIAQALYAPQIRLGALTPTRDFTYVTDTVAGFLDLARSDAALGRSVNLGSGHEISVGALAERIVGLVGRPVPVVSAEERLRPEHSEVIRLLSDPSLVHRLTGWRTRVDFDTGLQRVITFLRSHPTWTRTAQYEF